MAKLAKIYPWQKFPAIRYNIVTHSHAIFATSGGVCLHHASLLEYTFNLLLLFGIVLFMHLLSNHNRYYHNNDDSYNGQGCKYHSDDDWSVIWEGEKGAAR